MRTIERDVVAAVIFSKDGKIFLGQQKEGHGGVYVDCWRIPGGGIEQGETKEQALVREVQEETGIDLHGLHLKDISRGQTGMAEKKLSSGEAVRVHMRFFDFEVHIPLEATRVAVVKTNEIYEHRWVLPHELTTLKLTPPLIALSRSQGWL